MSARALTGQGEQSGACAARDARPPTILAWEWRRLWAWSALILGLSCLPYLAAWFTTPAGYRFSGLVANPWDGYSYLAKMREGWAGTWQFHLPFTPEPHAGTYIYLYYLALGHLARVTGLPLAAVYHLARLAGGLALLVCVYVLAAHLTGDRRQRGLLFWLAALGTGVGWLAGAGENPAIDLWVAEGFAFYSVLANPHFPLAIALMLVTAIGVAWPWRAPWRWLAPAGAALALAIVQPFALVPLFAALGLYLALRGPGDRAWLPQGFAICLAAGLAALPVLLYDLLVYRLNPVLEGWASQNVMPTPPLPAVILGYGALLVLAAPGALAALRGRSPGGLLLVAWAGTALALAYAPLDLQRRFLIGLSVPLGLLAGLGLFGWLLPLLPARWRRTSLCASVAAATLGNLALLVILGVPALSAGPAGESIARLRLTEGEARAMAWLRVNAAGQVVLADPQTGAILPGEAGVRVFAGHPLETVDAPRKMAQAEDFFGDRLTDDQWREIRSRFNIRYVFDGPRERSAGEHRWQDRLGREAVMVYEWGGVRIYRLR